MGSPRLLLALTAVLVFVLSGCRGVAQAGAEMTARARRFVAEHEKRIKPLEIAAAQAWWDANTTGQARDFARKVETQNRIDKALAQPKHFAELKALEGDRDQIDEPLLARTIHVLYL